MSFNFRKSDGCVERVFHVFEANSKILLVDDRFKQDLLQPVI